MSAAESSQAAEITEGAMKKTIHVTVNGLSHQNEIEPRLLLVQYIRDVLNLTGTHVGCETSLCGACTVMVDGQAVKSCTVLAAQADGSTVTTIEGLAQGGELHPVQKGAPRTAMRFLHARHDYDGDTDSATQSRPDGRRDTPRAGGEPLPLHGIPEHCAGNTVRGEEDEIEECGAVGTGYHRGHRGTRRKIWRTARDRNQKAADDYAGQLSPMMWRSRSLGSYLAAEENAAK
jgi:hypothetical protein